jgi:predicted nuclease of predicted toxin-antitoxin system
MKFLVDAHLPRRLAVHLCEAGHDALHTLDLPNQNRTSDKELIAIADRDQRVVVTKDADFVQSYALMRRPKRLLLISTGNITNKELEDLIIPNLPRLVTALETHHFVELSRNLLIVHD